jgi:glycosyltransferase involved in cell wall biosynthesis
MTPKTSIKPRVLIGVREVAGFYRALKFGFDELGIPCTYVSFNPHRFEYGGSATNRWTRWIQTTGQRRGKLWRWLNRAGRWGLFVWAVATHEVFVFGFGSSFFKNHGDLPILKRLGKKIVFQFHGSDARPPYMDGSVMAPARQRSVADCIALTLRKKRHMETIERYADVMINTPPQGLFHERPFAVWMRTGVAVLPPTDAELPSVPDTSNRPVRLLHCPSDPEAKGTVRLRAIVQSLQAKGLSVELIEITNQPNAVVHEALKACDIVLDQCYADYGMPGFATEAAWYGKPVIIGGYAVDLWRALLPPECVPPTLYCEPDDLAQAIETLVLDPAQRHALGIAARQFVETQWHPSRIAQRYVALLAGTAPDEWLFDPLQIRYWQGCCLEASQARALIHQVVQTGGLQALQLADKPALEAMFVEVAAQQDEPSSEHLEEKKSFTTQVAIASR